MQLVKVCTKCGEMKPLEDFDLDKRIRSGRIAKCKTCVRAHRRAHFEANREEMQAKRRRYERKWRRANPDKVKAKNQRGRLALRKSQPDYHREWYQRHIESERERIRISMRESRLRDPDAERQRKRRYRANNRQAVAMREREKTYARRAQQPFSRKLADYMAELVQQPCAYCGATENITIDHVVPLSRGGKHEATNLAPACFSCNSSKCALLLNEWQGPSLRSPSDHAGSSSVAEG